MTSRIEHYDMMKGIAIICVVIGHITMFSFGFKESDVVRFIGIFQMPIFFYISGYFFYKPIDRSLPYVKRMFKKVLSLIMPYVLFVFLWTTIRNEDFSKMLLGGGGQYWFLYTLLLLTIIFGIVEYVITRVIKISKDYLYIFAWLVVYAILIIIKYTDPLSMGRFGLLSSQSVVSYYRFFIVGYLCRKYIKINNIVESNNIVYAIAFIAFFMQWYLCASNNTFLIFAGGLSAILMLQRFCIDMSSPKLRETLSYIGQKSLAIYAIHFFFIPDLSKIVHNTLDVGNPFVWTFSWSLIVSAPIISCCLLIDKLIGANRYLNLIMWGRIKND